MFVIPGFQQLLDDLDDLSLDTPDAPEVTLTQMVLISTGPVSHMSHCEYKCNSFSFFNNLVWCYSKIVCTKLEFFAFPRWWESSLLVLLLMTVCHQLLLVIWEMLLLILIKRKYNFLLIVNCLFPFVADNMFKKITHLFTI